MRLGVDEAGRGCVLGPMVYGAVLVDEAGEEAMRALGVRDSKKIRASERERLRGRIEASAAGHSLLAIPVEQLDSQSLHGLGTAAVVELVVRLRPDTLVVDAPVPPTGIPRWRATLKEKLAERGLPDVHVVAENKADDNHPVCAAASILAKTERDRVLAELQEGREAFGSGYPSDPKTRRWLEETWTREGAFPPFVRTKWQTVRRIVAGGSQGRLF